MQSKEQLEIKERFNKCLNGLVKIGELKGIKTFTTVYELDYGNFRKHLREDNLTIKAEWIMFLCRDFSVSPHFVILGEGNEYLNPRVQKKYEELKEPVFKYRYNERPFRVGRAQLSLFK